MSDNMAKVIQLRDIGFQARRRSAPRHWPSQSALASVTSLTRQVAPVSPRRPRGLADQVRTTIANGIRGSAYFAHRRLTGAPAWLQHSGILQPGHPCILLAGATRVRRSFFCRYSPVRTIEQWSRHAESVAARACSGTATVHDRSRDRLGH